MSVVGGIIVRSTTIVCILAISCLLLEAVQAPDRSGARRLPNLLLITFDTTRADRLGCYGYPGVEMPSISRLAKEGVLFTNAYCQAVQTLPSHTSLLTGLYPITNNVVSNGQHVSENMTTLAEILDGIGYRTGAIVATSPLLDDFNLDQGFETYNDSFQGAFIENALKSFVRAFSFSKLNIPSTRPAHRVAVIAKKWLRRAAKKQHPFFLWIHFIDPHHPYDFHPNFREPKRVVEEGTLNAFGEEESNYVNEIEFADFYLGQVLEQLDDLGLTDDTLTIFTADHGESLGEHGYRGHREEVYQSIIRVPLIFRFPGRLPAGKRLTTPAMLLDVMPTILKLMAVPFTDHSFQGEDLFALRENEPRKIYAVAVELFTKSPIRIAMICGNHKYISFDDPEENALYNIRSDPDELVNLLGHGKTPAGGLNWQVDITSWWEANDRLEPTEFRMSPELLNQLKSLGYVK